jgi:membrane fusion protein, multidrug efflux system
MKRSIILITVIAIVLIGAIVVTLISNKQKINAANQTIDRSHIPVTVTTLKINPSKIQSKTILSAKLKPFEEAVISIQASGLISYLSIDFGSKVQKGQVVGAIDTKIAQLNLKSTTLTKDKLKEDYERAKDLYGGKAASEVNMNTAKYNYENTTIQLEQIKQQINNANIVAPIDGIVINSNIKAGEYVNPGATIASLVNISKLKATVFVDETEVYSIHTDQVANVSSSVFPDKKWVGKVVYVSPYGDENHNYQVDVLLNNTPEILKAGTNVSVEFKVAQKENVIVIPKKALVVDRKDPYVYIIRNGIAHGCNVVVGLSEGNNIEIISGLFVGDELVLSGQINLTEGSKTTIVKQ